MIPGEFFIEDGTIELNAGRERRSIEVANSGDRPIQVGSHYHFYETNAALQFEREGRARRIATPDALLRGPICCFSRRGEMLRPAQRMFIAALERAAAQLT